MPMSRSVLAHLMTSDVVGASFVGLALLSDLPFLPVNPNESTSTRSESVKDQRTYIQAQSDPSIQFDKTQHGLQRWLLLWCAEV